MSTEEWVIKFPEKWVVQNTNSIIGKYFDEQSDNYCYEGYTCEGYLHSHNYRGECILDKRKMGASFGNIKKTEGFTEISFQVFKTYVLNKGKTIIGYKVPFDIPTAGYSKDQVLTKSENPNWYSYQKRGRTIAKEIVERWEPVYELMETHYTMGLGSDTFTLTVREGKCFHKTGDITDYVKTIQTLYSHIICNKHFATYDFNIKDMIISKTGCEGKDTLLSQWLAIKV